MGKKIVTHKCRQCLVERTMSYGLRWSIIKNNAVCRKCADINRVKYIKNENGFYERTCQSCNKIVLNKSRSGYKKAIKDNHLCYSCCAKIKTPKIQPDESGLFIRFCPQCNKKVFHTANSHRNTAVKKKRLCKNCSLVEAGNRPEVKQKLRDSFKKRASGKTGCFVPSYNPSSCVIFNKINSEVGLNGLHAENGGEYLINGYFLDYYDKELNLAIEFDESFHKGKKYSIPDAIREDKIKSIINCTFLRIKEGEDINIFIKTLKEWKVKHLEAPALPGTQ